MEILETEFISQYDILGLFLRFNLSARKRFDGSGREVACFPEVAEIRNAIHVPPQATIRQNCNSTFPRVYSKFHNLDYKWSYKVG
jgi:hypothetical protein